MEFVLQVRPGMTADQVKALFPSEMLWKKKQLDKEQFHCQMDRRWSPSAIEWVLEFSQPNTGYRVATVYFDAKNVIAGIDFSGSSGRQLRKTELRFPGEIKDYRMRVCRCNRCEKKEGKSKVINESTSKN